MKNDLVRKYLWILDTLYRTGGITFAELSRRWERSAANESKGPLTRRTFINCKEAIQTNFFITIDALEGSTPSHPKHLVARVVKFILLSNPLWKGGIKD